MIEGGSFYKRRGNVQMCSGCTAGRKFVEDIRKNGYPNQNYEKFWKAMFQNSSEFLAENCEGLPEGICEPDQRK
jgi:hypothetical protein